MGYNDHFDQELSDLVGDLVDGGYLEVGTPAYGVAAKAAHDGYASLTPKQRGLYDAVVTPAFMRHHDYVQAKKNKEMMDRDD